MGQVQPPPLDAQDNRVLIGCCAGVMGERHVLLNLEKYTEVSCVCYICTWESWVTTSKGGHTLG